MYRLKVHGYCFACKNCRALKSTIDVRVGLLKFLLLCDLALIIAKEINNIHKIIYCHDNHREL